MKTVTLSCWEHFRCTAEECRHSCCKGWEIDVDNAALRRYAEVSGELGQRLRQSIAVGDEGAFFVLQGEDERCPFLNERGLCDIILALGEDALCDICAEHPRFRNYIGDREELGFGLCCEEAVRELLEDSRPLRLVTVEDDGEPEELSPWGRTLTETREELFAVAGDSRVSPRQRSELILRRVNARLPDMTAREWSGVLRGLERLDPAWDEALDILSAASLNEETEAPGQLLTALLYRHLTPAESMAELRERAAFSVLSFRLLGLLSAKEPERLPEWVRLWSGEIEYSDENLPALLELCRQ